jgi:serine/threonine protein kinase
MTVGANACVSPPGYMSPEQASREELDGRSDLYAVGIVLWERLAHERLRAGLSGDDGAINAFQAIRRPSEYRQRRGGGGECKLQPPGGWPIFMSSRHPPAAVSTGVTRPTRIAST